MIVGGRLPAVTVSDTASDDPCCPPPSVAEARRRPAEELHGLIEDMIKLLESRVQPDLRRGRYPDRRNTKRVAEVVRAVARELDP